MPIPGSRTASWPTWSRVSARSASRGVALTRRPERSPGARWAELTQLAIERGGVALQDHLRDVPDRGALVHKSATKRDLLRRQLRRAPEAHTPPPGPHPPPPL